MVITSKYIESLNEVCIVSIIMLFKHVETSVQYCITHIMSYRNKLVCKCIFRSKCAILITLPLLLIIIPYTSNNLL